MIAASRAVATLGAVLVGGVLLWLATHMERGENYGYWEAYGIVAAAGLVFGLAQIRGRRGNPPLMFALAFLPVLIAAGWVLLAMQPQGNWFRAHTLSWSETAGIEYVVKALGTWVGVLAFGIGYTLGLTLEPAPAPEPEPEVVRAPGAYDRRATYDRRAADEPVAAERREVTAEEEERAREAQPVR
jgi:hypothetical protein